MLRPVQMLSKVRNVSGRPGPFGRGRQDPYVCMALDIADFFSFGDWMSFRWYSTDEKDGNDIGDPESNNQEIVGKKSRKRDRKHSVLVDSGGDDSVMQRLPKEYRQAMEMTREMKGCTAKPETRNLTLNNVESALFDLDQGSTNGPWLQVVLQKLEKSDYRLYGIRVRCRGRKGKGRKEKGTMITRGDKTGEVVGPSKPTKIRA